MKNISVKKLRTIAVSLLTLYAVLLIISLVACTPTTKKTDSGKVLPTIHAQRPQPIELLPVKWVFVNYKNKDAVILDDKNTYTCLSWDDYITMSENMSMIKTNMIQTNKLLCNYRKDLNEVECRIPQNQK